MKPDKKEQPGRRSPDASVHSLLEFQTLRLSSGLNFQAKASKILKLTGEAYVMETGGSLAVYEHPKKKIERPTRV
jgi:hypothetical protein